MLISIAAACAMTALVPACTMPASVPLSAGAATASGRCRIVMLKEGSDPGELNAMPFEDVPDLPPPSPPPFSVLDLSGISPPLGFFDPAGFSKGASEGRIKFYREVELKHGRVAMLAALGFPLAETFHPIFSEVDVPSYSAHYSLHRYYARLAREI